MQNCEFDIYDGDKKVRFLLGQDGSRKLFVIGLNPSTADAKKSDQTVSKVKRFTEGQERFDGFVILNLCPLRSTNPNALPKSESKEMIRLTGLNNKTIHEMLEPEIAPVIWAAWGNNIRKRPYLFSYLHGIVTIAAIRKAEWKMCGKFTKRGHPRHPSRLGYQNEFQPFDIEKYLCAFAPLR